MTDSATLHTHIALVPVSAVDSQIGQALTYAATLAPQVLAVHLRTDERGQTEAIEDEWTRSGARLPLLILEASRGDSAGAFRRAVEVLKRTQRVDQITIVLPWYPPGNRGPEVQAATWCAELQGQRGIAVRQMPARS
jgi:hypothetical protein